MLLPPKPPPICAYKHYITIISHKFIYYIGIQLGYRHVIKLIYIYQYNITNHILKNNLFYQTYYKKDNHKSAECKVVKIMHLCCKSIKYEVFNEKSTYHLQIYLLFIIPRYILLYHILSDSHQSDYLNDWIHQAVGTTKYQFILKGMVDIVFKHCNII